MERTKKTELNLNVEFGGVLIFTISTARKIMESLLQFHALKDVIETTPPPLFTTPRLKKSTFKGWRKIFPFCFSFRPGSHTKNPSDCLPRLQDLQIQ